MGTLSLDRASLAIAEADFFGDRLTCERFGVSCRSLQRWKARARNDPALARSVADKKRLLLETWQIEAIAPLKVACQELARRMPLAKDATDAKVIFAISGVVKTVGELQLGTDLLLGETK